MNLDLKEIKIIRYESSLEEKLIILLDEITNHFNPGKDKSSKKTRQENKRDMCNYLLSPDTDFETYLAVKNNKIIGMAAVNPKKLTDNKPEYLNEYLAYVQKPYRKNGVWKKLNQHLVNICKERDYKGITTYIEKSNEASIRAAESFGFQRIESDQPGYFCYVLKVEQENRIKKYILDFPDKTINVAALEIKSKILSPESMLEKILETRNYDYDVLIAPEYSFMPLNKVPMAEKIKNDYLDEIKKISSNKLIIPGTFLWQKNGERFNTCYSIADNTILNEYHKNTNGGDSLFDSFSITTHFYGDFPGEFIWNNLDIGIEICSDMGLTRLKDMKEKDILFGLCYGCNITPIYGIKKTGYGVKIDGKYINSSVVSLNDRLRANFVL